MNERIVFALTQQEADWWIITLCSHMSLVPADIGVELSEVLVTEIGDFELNQSADPRSRIRGRAPA